MAPLETTVIKKISWRIMPFLLICYFGAYLDRFNIAYAALTMNHDLGFNSEIFGFGAGLFFLGYCAFEIPSNMLLYRLGARVWIARIMITWGILASCTAFIHGSTEFFATRFLLGLAEAGFFPGIIFYLSLWYPAQYRARMIGLFMLAIPVSGIIGAPLSGIILHTMVNVGGLQSWRWLFLLEGAPVVALGLLVLMVLSDRPANAKWLTDAEKTWLIRRLAVESNANGVAPRPNRLSVIFMPRVLALSAVCFCVTSTTIALGVFLPLIVKVGFGLPVLPTTLIVMLPYVIGAASMFLIGLSSDRYRERKWHVVFAFAIGAVGIGLAGLSRSPVWEMVGICIASIGIFGIYAPFWAFASFLTGEAAAIAIATINAIGQLSGFVGPFMVGTLKHLTGTFGAALLALAALRLVAIVIVMIIGRTSHETAMVEVS